MPIALRILSGTRAGESESFDQPVIAVGRSAASDLRFDATRDLDVSAAHAELRAAGGGWTVHDRHSTNGTYVNGERVPAGGARELLSSDVIVFGAGGPTVEVSFDARRPTVERVATAVREQTRGLRVALAAVVVVLGGLAFGGYWLGHRESAAAGARIAALVASNDQTVRLLEARLQGMGDTALIAALRRRNDSLLTAARAAPTAERAAIVQRGIAHGHELQRTLQDMDLPAVRDANDAAVVLIVAEVHGTSYEATGFAVNAGGLIVTNRHVVHDSGAAASRVAVKFANTSQWHAAHVVTLAAGASADLALVQVDDAGTYPTVREVAASIDTPVGGTIATLGFPLGSDLVMQGTGNDLVAKTTLTIGTVSKAMDDLLQIDSFASHGSSGSPVFDTHGRVIGVVWGGPPGAAGRIVYAVPSPLVADLIRSAR